MTRDRCVAVICLAIGLAIAASSLKLAVGTFTKPGPGLYPFLIGLVITALSLVLLVSPVSQKSKGKSEAPILGGRWGKVPLVLGAVMFYALTLGFFGFPLTTFLFMVLVLKFIQPQRWAVVLGTALLSTSFSYLLFSVWLQIEFPKGIIGY